MNSTPTTGHDSSTHTPTDDQVVLVDESANPIGRAPRLAVHTAETPLHLAFSTYLFNRHGQVLITRRALGKGTWPGVWTNSCCGHPRPGESLDNAMRRRIREELGAEVGPLTRVLPGFRYRAVDASGVVENEICPVSAGVLESEVHPNPSEVMEVAWVSWDDLVAAVSATPQVYSPWAVQQVSQLGAALPTPLPASQPPSPDVSRCLADVEEFIGDELDRLTDAWQGSARGLGLDVMPVDLPAWVSSQLRDGKRFRVSMTYWGFVAAGGVGGGPGYRTMVRAASALELLHLFALIHDDVMDGSASRRGRPSAHVEAKDWHQRAGAVGDPEVFARNLAILVGDLAHMVADATADRLPEPMRSAWYDLCLELIAGQRADLTGAAASRRDLAHAREVARLKSGRYTVTRPLQLGALAAAASPEILEVLERAGDEIGQAFAYRDDILGAWGDPAQTGKPSGDDLAEGKATVILALAQQRLDGAATARLDRLGTPAMRPGDVVFLQEALVGAGIRDEIEAMIAQHLDTAYAHLESGPLAAAGVTGLKRMAHAAAWRHQ